MARDQGTSILEVRETRRHQGHTEWEQPVRQEEDQGEWCPGVK